MCFGRVGSARVGSGRIGSGYHQVYLIIRVNCYALFNILFHTNSISLEVPSLKKVEM
jgi:hypothetical protein